MENNIFKILKTDNNVNKYTKLILMLYQMNFYKRYYIPNRLISNMLNIKDISDCTRLLNKIKQNGIIKIYYIGRRRYFKFVKQEDLKDFDYDWLNEDNVTIESN